MKKIKFLQISSFLLLLATLSGCIQHYPLNLSIAKERVQHYYESGRYQSDKYKIIARAIHYFKRITPHKNSVVIFDIDDTALSNYADEKSISFGYIPKLFHEWVMKADAPAIIQTKNFYDYLIRRNFRVIFLTGRKHNQYDATIKNLNRAGFTKFDRLIVRSKEEEHLTAQAYKTQQRKQLILDGYHIIASIGDQWSDLRGGYSGYMIKMPNFRYMLP